MCLKTFPLAPRSLAKHARIFARYEARPMALAVTPMTLFYVPEIFFAAAMDEAIGPNNCEEMVR